MAETEDREPDLAGHGVAPGALSALLRGLAHVPEVVPPPPLPSPGTLIDRFELVREIGGGGFGVVYEAHDRKLRRSVAFKLVRPRRLEGGAEQLGREAEIIAQLSHPNLVTLYDVGQCDHGPYLVLELLRGVTLEEQMKHGPLPVKEAVRIATEIAKGLSHAHGQGVVHRDLKPSNVFLCEDGRVKVLDFGLSRAFGVLRLDGGTPRYMAPEQWRAAPEDERTDVYALGVILFEMLANESPFRTDDGGRTVLKARKAPALDVPGRKDLGELVARMLEKDPTKRPRNGAEVLGELQAETDRAQEERAGPVRKVRRPWRRAIALLAAGLVVGAGAWAGVERLRKTRPAPERARAIAVLPFVNLTDSPDNEYFSDGLTEEILGTLTRLRELKVAARSSSFYFKGRKVEVGEVARRLRVDVVLEGSVRRNRDRLRISAELIDGRSGFHIWAQTYDRRLEDVFEIQDDIARRVVGALELVLSRASEDELPRPRAASLAAYDLHLRGRAQLRLAASKGSLERATALFERAVALDPEFAQAHAGLCEVWLARYEMERAGRSFEQAEAACTKALARDPEDGEVFVALGNLHLSSGRHEQAEREFQQASTLPSATVDALLGLARAYREERRTDEAEKTFEKAARLDPGYWRVHQLRGNFYLGLGRWAEAARSYAEEIASAPDNAQAQNNLGAALYMAGDLEKAAQAWRASLELAPMSSAYSNTGTSYYYLGRFPEAAAMYSKALALAPEDHRVWGNLGDAYSRVAGREDEAAAAYRKAVSLGERRLRINPSDANAMSDLAHYHARLGHADRARRLCAEASRLDPENAYVHYNTALVDMRLGATDAALAELERAVVLGHQRHFLPMEPAFEPLRRDERFGALLAPAKR